MLHRIRWRELAGEHEPAETLAQKHEERDSITDMNGRILCKLVWKGQRKSANFTNPEMQVLKMQSDLNAKDYFMKNNILDYWHTIQAELLITGQD